MAPSLTLHPHNAHARTQAVLRQEVGWFDKNATGELTTRMMADTTLIQEGISDKPSLILQFTSAFITGFVIAFVRSWKLTLVLLSVIPLLVLGVVLMGKALAGK
jgi:ABC-type multidrug transport system fused ATPase/permease subunit